MTATFKHRFDGKTVSLVQFNLGKPVLFGTMVDILPGSNIIVVHGDKDEVQVWNFGHSMLDQLRSLADKVSLADCSLRIETQNGTLHNRPFPTFQLLQAPRKPTDHLQADIDRLEQWTRRLIGTLKLKVDDLVTFGRHHKIRGVVIREEFDGKVQIRWEDGTEHEIDVCDQNLMLIEDKP